jgi:hypothetical protein
MKKWNRAWKIGLINEMNPTRRDLFEDFILYVASVLEWIPDCAGMTI